MLQNMFRLTRKPSSGSYNQYFAKNYTVMAAYAAITLTTSCTASTYLLLTKCVIFSKVLVVAP